MLLKIWYGRHGVFLKSCCADCPVQGNVSVEHAAVIEQLTALQEQHKELLDLDTSTKVGTWMHGISCKHTR